MNLTTKYMTQNDCYKDGRKITVKGIMVHSTATPGVMAAEWYSRWNKPDVAKCVHAFVDDKGVFQYLPWNHRGWHGGGSSNNTHIGFEMCESKDLNDKTYFAKVYTNAVELTVYLCKMYGLTEKDVLCHCEGYKKGIASNHGDVMHWFPKHGKDMNDFRADVKKGLAGNSTPTPSGPIYRIRKTWADEKSQIGAYKILDSAKEIVNKNPGYFVFDEKGNVVYPVQVPTPKPENLYRVRKSWDDVKGQIGAYADLNNAIDIAKANVGYNVYDSNGKQVYPILTTPQPIPTQLYRVRKTWEDIKTQIGAYKELVNAKEAADKNPGYLVFDDNGKMVYTPEVKQPEPKPEEPKPEPIVKHLVMGNGEITIEQAETFLHKENPDAPYYAAFYKEEGEKEGIRWDFAFAQSILETGYFRFNGDVKPEQNNFAGIGTVGGGVPGASFATPQIGIQAQIQHLKAYASTEPLVDECVDPRFNLVQRGKAPYIEDFGNGIWAASKDNYGGRIYQLFEQMKATIGEPLPQPEIPEEPNEENEIELTPETISAFKIVIQFIIDFIKKIFGRK